MNTIIKTTPVAVLITLALALAAQAAEPPKTEASGEVYVADLPWTSSTPGVRKNLAPSGSKDIPIKIGTVTYARGIGTMTDQSLGKSFGPGPAREGFQSSVVVDITGKGFRSLSADVGNDTPGSACVYLLLVDGGVKARVRTVGLPEKLSADVTSGRKVMLMAIAEDKTTQANWGDAKLSTAPPPAPVPMGPADQRWDLKTGSTDLTLGRQGGRVGIYSLKRVGSTHNWTDSPSEIPLMTRAEANRVVHALKWVFRDATVDDRQGTKVTLRFVNAAPPLTLESEWWARPGSGPVRTAMTIRNDAKEPVTLFYQPSLRLRVTGNGPTASWCIGSYPTKWWGPGLERFPLATKKPLRRSPSYSYGKLSTVVTEAGRHYTDIGWAGHYAWGDWGKYIPFLGLDVGDTQGMYVGVEWSVGWIYQNDVSVNTTVVEANGYENGDDFSSAVPAGGTFVVPPAFVGAYTGDLDDAGNDLKKYLWNYSMPEILRKDETYPKVQWNGYLAVRGDQTPRSRWYLFIDAIAPLGFEEAMHDTGWYGAKGPRSDRFPQGMKAAADYTKAKGLRMGLYWPNAFVYADIKRLFDDYGAAIWRSDFCPNDYKDYDSTRKTYELLDRLQKDLPAFEYENCSGGGHVKDFGVMKRAVKIFNVEASFDTLAQEAVFWDSSYLFPPIQLEGSCGSRVGTGVAGLVYTFRSAAQGAPEWFLGSPDGGGIKDEYHDGITPWTQEEKDAIRTVVATYKAKVRPLQRNSNLYHLTARPNGTIWYAFQYYKPEEKKGVVYVLKRKSPVESQVIKLKGLDPAATYAVTFADGSNPPVTRTGAELMNAGIQVTLKGQYVSEWIFLN